MTEETRRPRPRSPHALFGWLTVVLFAVGMSAAGAAAWYLIFSGFRAYDDEGYVLLSLRQVSQGHALYDRVYSQYGPAFFAVQLLPVRVFGLPVTHDLFRGITLAQWILTALLAAATVWRIARTPAAGVVAFVVTFACLRVAGWEPTHPQTLCALYVLAAVFTGTFADPTRRGRLAAGVLGVLTAVLAMTKVNLGGYLFIAVALACITAGGVLNPVWGRVLRVGAVLVAVLLPAALMQRLILRAEWAALAILMSGTTVVAFVLASRHRAEGAWEQRGTGLALAGFVVTIAVVFVGSLASGTTPYGFVYGLLLQHLGFAGILMVPPDLTPVQVGGVAAAASALLLSVRLLRSRGGKAARSADDLVAAAKLAFGVATLWLALGPSPRPREPPALWLAGFVWLGALPPANLPATDAPPLRFGRTLLVLAAAVELLWMFPVAGAQRLCALVLPTCVAALCLGDGIREAAARLAALGSRLRVEAFVGLLAAALAVWRGSDDFGVARSFYEGQTPLGLPGARRMRVAPEDAAVLRELAAEVSRSPDTFFSRPGFNSLYLWAQKDPPTDLNIGGWMTHLNDRQQRQVIRELAPRDRLIVVYGAEAEDFWRAFGGDVSRKPLVVYLQGHFEPYRSVGGYVLLRRRSTEPAPETAAENPLTRP
jgi:hypothetical protein